MLPEAQDLKGGLFDVNKLPVVLVLEHPVSQHTPAAQNGQVMGVAGCACLVNLLSALKAYTSPLESPHSYGSDVREQAERLHRHWHNVRVGCSKLCCEIVL